MNNDLEEAIKALIPKSLDDIVRANRDCCAITLATTAQLNARAAPILGDPAVREEIHDWRFVAITMKIGDRCAEKVILLGCTPTGRQWGTSSVEQIDFERRLVRTSNSHYCLADPRGAGEPEFDGLMHLCAMLSSWGLSGVFGSPAVFY